MGVIALTAFTLVAAGINNYASGLAQATDVKTFKLGNTTFTININNNLGQGGSGSNGTNGVDGTNGTNGMVLVTFNNVNGTPFGTIEAQQVTFNLNNLTQSQIESIFSQLPQPPTTCPDGTFPINGSCTVPPPPGPGPDINITDPDPIVPVDNGTNPQ